MDDTHPPFLEPIEEEALVHHFQAMLGDDLAWMKGTPKTVLRRIVPDDVLSFGPACAKCIENEALFIAPARLSAKSLAIVAHQASRFPDSRLSLSTWLVRRIGDAVDQVVNDDWEADQFGIPPLESADFDWIAQTFEVSSIRARRLSLAFNLLPRRARRAFQAVAIQGMALNRYVALGHGPPAQVTQDIERAFEAIADILEGGSEQ